MRVITPNGSPLTPALPLKGGGSAVLCLLALLSIASIARAQADQPPAAPREFRAVWVASVNNGNWPSKAGLSVEQQKAELIRYLDAAVSLRLNAVIFQVRPAADALYASKIEPWSEYLTGMPGQAPTPFYDPLQTWIDEAHKRGLELHAWFNPYRVRSGESKLPRPATSIARTHPEVVKEYGNQLWMDPGEPLASQQTLAVIQDIVTRYDVDGIHTDDYYYPYQVNDRATKKPIDFPDVPSYTRYQRTGGKLQIKDWRRKNVDDLIQTIYTQTKKTKPWVKVGYAPFGIWQPNNPPGIKGLNQYDTLYADAKLWLNQGWLDYMSPQLYWKIGGDQSFPELLKWWLSENTQKRAVWPGISVGRHPVPETLAQLDLTRKLDSNGIVFWSVNSLLRKEGLGKALADGPYREPALIPAMQWLDKAPPNAPAATAQKSANAVVVSLKPGKGEPTALYAIYAKYGQQWRFVTLPGGAPSITLNADPAAGLASGVVVSAVDRCGNESSRVNVAVR